MRRHLGWVTILLLVPVSAQADDDVDVEIRATSAGGTGWTTPEGALTFGSSSRATDEGATLQISDFDLASIPVRAVSLRVVASQIGHTDDMLDLSLDSPGCSSVTTQPQSLEPSATRQEFGVAANCQGGWSDDAVRNLTLTITTRAVGGILLLDGIDGDWIVHEVWLSVTTARGAAEDAGIITVPGAAPAWPFWLAGATLLVAAIVIPLIIVAARRRQAEETMEQALRNDDLVQFLNNASHDLASPLTPIKLQLALLAGANQEKMTEKQAKALAVVKRNVEQMGMLVTDLRDASRVQAGRLDMHAERADLSQLVQEVDDAFRPQCDAKGVALQVKCPKSLPAKIDSGRITQVFYNLVGNALKFTDSGSLEMSVVKDGKFARVAIKDSGIGMSKDDASKLFQAFSQAHDAKQKAKGSGLGLYICKGIVEAHGGQIGASSEGPGKGSTFWFTLPLE